MAKSPSITPEFDFKIVKLMSLLPSTTLSFARSGMQIYNLLSNSCTFKVHSETSVFDTSNLAHFLKKKARKHNTYIHKVVTILIMEKQNVMSVYSAYPWSSYISHSVYGVAEACVQHSLKPYFKFRGNSREKLKITVGNFHQFRSPLSQQLKM